MSPRRSSRARSSANPPPAPSQSASSTSSSTIKNTRAVQRSESVEDPNPDDDASLSQAPTSEPVVPRRSRRNGPEDLKQNPDSKLGDDEEVLIDEDHEPEEEVTRCICGNAEYPGPTQYARDMAKGTEFLDTLGDDLGNFFVQCDRCAVWQHGGCMGLIDEGNLPDQYFCEQCKPDLHRVMKGSTGNKSSRYLPVLQTIDSRDSSLSSTEQRKKDLKNRQENTKRRATMNSRVAYDEDELLRRAIEESREMGTLGKRTREDGDDPKLQIKRQRTASSGSDTASKRSQSPTTVDEIPGRVGAKTKQSLRGAAAKNTKEKEIREKQKEQAAAVKAEAANKRNARSERRRGDESPPPSPSLSPSKQDLITSKDVTSTANTPTPVPGQTTKARSKPRAPVRRGRLGRNQYTKARDDRDAADSDTPLRDTSHDRNLNGHSNGNNDSPQGRHNKINGESGRSSKAKTHPARTSINEMKRRVAAILEFVGQLQTQTQAQRNGSKSAGSSGKGGTPNVLNDEGGSALGVAGLVKAVQAAREEVNNVNVNGDAEEGENGTGAVKLNLRDDGEFRCMDSGEMMETLTKELVGWQSVYGVYSR